MSSARNVRERVRHEAKSFAVIFVYVWTIMALLAMHKAFILQRSPSSGQLFAIINAAVLAKVILVLELFKIGELFQSRPAIYRIIFKSVLFGLLLLVFHVAEVGVDGWFHHKTFAQGLAEIDGGRLMEIVTLAIMMMVALLPYLLLREIAHAVGGQKVAAILFRPPVASTLSVD